MILKLQKLLARAASGNLRKRD